MSEKSTGTRLNELLAAADAAPLGNTTIQKFEAYLSIFVRWNERLNLSGLRDEESILSRHLVESVIVARALPAGIGTLLDYGSGGGLPGIPIALCRPEVAVTLAESQNKKAAFLQEAARTLEIRASVYAGRAEELQQFFDCVTLRAVDKMPRAVTSAIRLVAPEGWLALMTTGPELGRLQAAARGAFSWSAPTPLPHSSDRILAFGQRRTAHVI